MRTGRMAEIGDRAGFSIGRPATSSSGVSSLTAGKRDSSGHARIASWPGVPDGTSGPCSRSCPMPSTRTNGLRSPDRERRSVGR